MRSVLTLICVLLLFCTSAVVAQDPQIKGSSPSAMSADSFSRPSAPGTRRAARANTDVRTPSNAEVPLEAPVVTIEGVCDRPQISKAKDCETVITRAQMESLIDLLAPGASQAVRRQFTINYARLLAASAVAEKKSLEKDPEVVRQLQAQLKVARMQVLAHTLYQQIESQAESATPAEIQKYYQEHLSSFDEGEVLRLSVPRTAPTTDGRLLDDSAVRNKAEELRQRAVAGEDFEQLQHDAYVALGISATGPPTKLNRVRRKNLPAGEARVFDLQPGEVTPVLESLGSLVILKLVSKQSVPAGDADAEIKSLLRQARMQEQLESATKTVKAQFNLRYLDMSSAPVLFPPPEEAERTADSRGFSDERSRMMNRRALSSNTRRTLRRPLM